MSTWACSVALACCTGMALSQAQHTLRGNKNTLDGHSFWWKSIEQLCLEMKVNSNCCRNSPAHRTCQAKSQRCNEQWREPWWVLGQLKESQWKRSETHQHHKVALHWSVWKLFMKLTSTTEVLAMRLTGMSVSIVFVFTLDCNTRIYCYNTEDECFSSRLAERAQLSEVLAWRLKFSTQNSPVPNNATMGLVKCLDGSMSTVLAQDHFFSDFLSLHLTTKNHKVSMMMRSSVASRFPSQH